MIQLLLVCGSRALAGTPGETWARRVLTARIGELLPGATVLHGGCPNSPDAWAGEIGNARGDLVVRAMHANGQSEVTVYGNTLAGQWRREVRPATVWAHFAARNEAMVTEAVAAQAEGKRAMCLCLAATDSKTRGGPWTAERARGAGIESWAFWWP